MVPNKPIARARALELAADILRGRSSPAEAGARTQPGTPGPAFQLLAGRYYAFLLADNDYALRSKALGVAVDRWKSSPGIDTIAEAERNLDFLNGDQEPTWRADGNLVRGPIEVLIPAQRDDEGGIIPLDDRSQLAKRIARLLNEDDAKGQITIRVHAGHRTTEEQERAWSDYCQGSRR